MNVNVKIIPWLALLNWNSRKFYGYCLRKHENVKKQLRRHGENTFFIDFSWVLLAGKGGIFLNVSATLKQHFNVDSSLQSSSLTSKLG